MGQLAGYTHKFMEEHGKAQKAMSLESLPTPGGGMRTSQLLLLCLRETRTVPRKAENIFSKSKHRAGMSTKYFLIQY